ncbi:MAG TPA: hypothetical protein VN155_11435 [Devosia sp.]|nr:hypothetical protein [Devosia sp.]
MSSVGADSATLRAQSRSFALSVLRSKAGRLLDILVGFWIFSGGFVLFEPSPYELTFLAVLPVAIFAGMGLYRSTFGLFAIMVGFTPFALIAVFQVRITPLDEALIFTVVTIFLLLTSYFIANYLAEDTTRRTRLVMTAYTAAAVMVALVAVLAYLGLIPGADLFVLYGRAKGTFKDPNVYGPFLVLPAMFALQRVLLFKGRKALIAAAIYGILFVGVFVSFSRAAWGHFALSSLMVLVLLFWLEAAARDKVRIMIMSLVGLVMLGVALGGLLSIPAVSSLFEQRAAGQAYDQGETGRFGRQGYAFDLALENPWGIGPKEFRNLKIAEDPHNVYAAVLHVYGWGGGFFYYMLAILTLWRGFSALARPSPYRLIMIPLISTFAMLAGESAIIDTDHWRHYFLIAGMIWGISTAIRNSPRTKAPREQMVI